MNPDETPKDAHERGKREGHVDAKIEEHDRHLEEINGVDRDQDREAAKLGRETQGQLSDVTSDVRKLGEDQRLRDEKVQVKEDTLAVETERRREELADSGSSFTKRQQLATLVIGVGGLVITLLVTQPWN